MQDNHRPRLLVVDDEASHLQALCDVLGEAGYDVHGCSGGAQALQALQGSTFDLLLTDLMMPGMNGIELLRAALAADPTLVVVLMTGKGTIATAVEAMQSGALDYVLKPFKLAAVLPVLRRGLAVRQLRLENAALERRVREHAAELEATNRDLEAFTRSASHDLRTPLNAVLGFSTLLAGALGPAAPPAQRRWLQQIDQAARQMASLIDALMRLSGVGRKALLLEAVDTAALVDEVVAELRESDPQRAVTVRIGALPRVVADASLLRQVFVNLLSNAFKYTRHAAAPTIDVRCEARRDEDVFLVRDNGAGFDMAHAARLFHAFERLHGPAEFEGHGIGLTVVQRVVQRHGGRIWAEAAPGCGATFWFALPRAAAAG